MDPAYQYTIQTQKQQPQPLQARLQQAQQVQYHQTLSQPPTLPSSLIYYPTDYSYYYYVSNIAPSNNSPPMNNPTNLTSFHPNSYYGVYTSPLGSISSVSSSGSLYDNNGPYYETNPSYASSGTIDYSSLVSYTVLPLLKRKRKRIGNSTSGPILPIEVPAHGEIFACDVCNKVFHKQYNLKSHMKTHSDEKPFQCSKCPKKFARSHDKKRHELLHQGIKNFKCQGYLKDGCTKWGCGKQFARSDALARHFRTETGWLCIKPLMDEAKRLEIKPVGQQYQQFQQIALQSFEYEQIPMNSTAGLLGSSGMDDELDNTRRMIPTTR